MEVGSGGEGGGSRSVSLPYSPKKASASVNDCCCSSSSMAALANSWSLSSCRVSGEDEGYEVSFWLSINGESEIWRHASSLAPMCIEIIGVVPALLKSSTIKSICRRLDPLLEPLPSPPLQVTCCPFFGHFSSLSGRRTPP